MTFPVQPQKPERKPPRKKHPPEKKGPAEFSVKISGIFHDSKSVLTARDCLFGRQLGRHFPLMSAKKGRSSRQKSKKRTPKLTFQRSIYGVVPVVGVEPTRCRQQRILSPSRLPIPTHRRVELFYYTINKPKNQVQHEEKLLSFFAAVKPIAQSDTVAEWVPPE